VILGVLIVVIGGAAVMGNPVLFFQTTDMI